MVYTNRPITKYCCSDLPQTEVRIIANFSIFSTLTCLFILFLAFAHLQSQDTNSTKSYSKFGLMSNITSSCFNETKENETQSNCTNENVGDTFVEYIEEEITTTTTAIPPSKRARKSSLKNSSGAKKESISTLEWICRLLLWERNVGRFWILLPFLWNVVDLLRALLLLTAIKTTKSFLLKLCYVLTSGNTVAGIIIFYPIFSKYKSGDLQATFVVIFLLLFFYNCYSLWILNVFLKTMSIIFSPSEQVLVLSTHDTGNSNTENENTHVQRF